VEDLLQEPLMSTRRTAPRTPARTQPIPVGIEALLGLAASDRAFAHQLLSDRRAALTERGIRLTPTEVAVFDAIDDGDMAVMIDRMRAESPDRDRRAFLARSAAALLVAAGGGVAWTQVSCRPAFTGSNPDPPQPPPLDAGPADAPAAPADDAPADDAGEVSGP
jgi:hypothetical protein